MNKTIYIVYENADKCEGRGPMRPIPGSGYFTNLESAWDFANTQTGIQGRRPPNGTWRYATCGDVEVRAFEPHDFEKWEKKIRLENEIDELEARLKLIRKQLQ